MCSGILLWFRHHMGLGSPGCHGLTSLHHAASLPAQPSTHTESPAQARDTLCSIQPCGQELQVPVLSLLGTLGGMGSVVILQHLLSPAYLEMTWVTLIMLPAHKNAPSRLNKMEISKTCYTFPCLSTSYWGLRITHVLIHATNIFCGLLYKTKAQIWTVV